MDKIRTLIVDDEPLAREGVRLLLQGDSQIDIVGECSSGRKAIEEILERSPDLVFLDVQMPEVDGFEVVAGVDPTRMPVVIFVTAYDRYAIRAFEVQALDYLLKPYTDARFRSVLKRAKTFIAKERLAELRTRLGTFLDAYSARLSIQANTETKGSFTLNTFVSSHRKPFRTVLAFAVLVIACFSGAGSQAQETRAKVITDP